MDIIDNILAGLVAHLIIFKEIDDPTKKKIFSCELKLAAEQNKLPDLDTFTYCSQKEMLERVIKSKNPPVSEPLWCSDNQSY